MSAKSILYGVVALLAGIAALQWLPWNSSSAQARTQIGSVVAEAEQRQSVHAAGVPAAITPAAVPALASPQPASRAARFEATQELSALLVELHDAAAHGDAEAARLAATAYDECYALSAQPQRAAQLAQYGQSLPEPQRSAALRHSRNLRQRCSSLLAAGAIAPDDSRLLHEKAVQAGDLASIAAELSGKAADMPEDSVRQTLRRIVATRDAEAIGRLAEVMGASSADQRDIYGPFSGSVADSLAWQLVACDLGRACGPDSLLVRTPCVSAGACLAGDFRDYLRHFQATPAQFEQALIKEKQLLERILAGEIDEIFP